MHERLLHTFLPKQHQRTAGCVIGRLHSLKNQCSKVTGGENSVLGTGLALYICKSLSSSL